MTEQSNYQKAFDEFGGPGFNNRLDLKNIWVCRDDIEPTKKAETVQVAVLQTGLYDNPPRSSEILYWLEKLAGAVNKRFDELREYGEYVLLEKHPDFRKRVHYTTAYFESEIGMVYLVIDENMVTEKKTYYLRTYFHVRKFDARQFNTRPEFM